MENAVGSHAAQMDAIYGAQRHIYDLTRKYYLLGRDRLIRSLDVSDGASVLELGCGTGRNLALAAHAWPGARLHGLDISREMLKSASINVPQAALAQGDATRFDARELFGRDTFERIFFSYTLSMIPDWRGAIEAAIACLAPDGQLHIVDFGQQQALPRWFRAGLHGWLAHFHVTPRSELMDVAHALAERHDLRVQATRLYRDYAWSLILSSS